MFRTRRELIERVEQLNRPQADEIAFLEAEAVAAKYTEYLNDAIPAFGQTPPVAHEYMRAYAQLSPDIIETGLEVRQFRAKEASTRKNTLYITELSLEMQHLLDDDGNVLPLHISQEHRAQQLAHLALVAQQPHVELRLIPPTEALPSINNVIQLGYADGGKDTFHESTRGLILVTGMSELARYDEGIAHLSAVALSQVATLEYIHGVS
jgi:hypothetical protein